MQSTTRSATLAVLGLLAVSATWGSSFPLTRVVLAQVSTPDFLAVRFGIATLVCLALFHRQVRALPRPVLLRGVILGTLYGAAQLLQTQGLVSTPAAVSGFITGLYVVLTPLSAALLLRARIGGPVWVAVSLASVGLGFLALGGSVSIDVGVWLTATSALFYAWHIVALSRWARTEQAIGLSVVQLGMTALLAGVGAAPGGVQLPSTGGAWWALIYMALISGALAMLIQSWAQSHLAPSRAAIIMSTEPLWSAAFSVAFFGEALTGRIVVGGLSILAAMLLIELRPRAAPGGTPDPRPEDVTSLPK